LLLCGLHVRAALVAKRSRGRRLLGGGYLRGGGLLRPHGLSVKKHGKQLVLKIMDFS
jgi:hypothetical protein